MLGRVIRAPTIEASEDVGGEFEPRDTEDVDAREVE